MKTLYEAGSAVEAHMLVDLLKQEGLSPHIHGEHLQGAVGELPAAGLVRVVIPEEEFGAAREVITRWESAQPVEAPRPTYQTKGGRGLWYFLAGLLIGTSTMYAFVRAPVSTDGVDYDRDGLVDEHWTYTAHGTPLRVEADRNLDKKIDYVGWYDDRGMLSTAQSDDNFDGRYETKMTFRAGNVETSQTDTDNDGYPDLFDFYENGVLHSTEYRLPNTGLPRRVEHFKLGRMIYADLDSDADGKLDTRVSFSVLGEEVSRTPLRR